MNITSETMTAKPNGRARRGGAERGAGLNLRRLIAAGTTALLGASTLGIGSAAAAGYSGIPAITSVTLAAAGTASAGPVFKAPWACGVTWHASTYYTGGGAHELHRAVDFNNLADGSDAGKPVLASGPSLK